MTKNAKDEMTETRNQVMNELRANAEKLEAMPLKTTILFPGWDLEYEARNGDDARIARGARIRAAARAILAEGCSPDGGTNVHMKSVGALVHYIADMLEE